MTTSKAKDANTAAPIRYYVSIDAEGGSSVSLLISDRRNYLTQQHDTIEEAATADPELLIDQIAGQSEEADYLLPDTPLKEAVFRVILAGRNESMSAGEISAELRRRWTMSAYPRNLSPSVVERLLQNMESYSIGSIVPPEPEAEEEGPADDASQADAQGIAAAEAGTQETQTSNGGGAEDE
jgi:hypothetical protein